MLDLYALTDRRAADPVGQSLLAFEVAAELDEDAVQQLIARFSHSKLARDLVQQLQDAAELRAQHVQTLRRII